MGHSASQRAVSRLDDVFLSQPLVAFHPPEQAPVCGGKVGRLATRGTGALLCWQPCVQPDRKKMVEMTKEEEGGFFE